ncbi:hypothetical protein V6N13_024035 [Hibiscus sabdariffa]
MVIYRINVPICSKPQPRRRLSSNLFLTNNERRRVPMAHRWWLSVDNGSRFNPLRVSEENVDDALPVPTDPLAEVPIQQVRSAASIPRVKPRNKGKSTTTFKANSSSHPHLDPLRHTAVVIDENSDLNVVLFPKDSTSLPQYDHNSPMGDPPDIPAPTSPLPSHRISLDINMKPKQIDEAYDALDPAQAVAMLK